jgi:YfiH family protein
MPSRLEFSKSDVFFGQNVCHAFLHGYTKQGEILDVSPKGCDEIMACLLETFCLKKVICLNQTHSNHIVIYPSSKGFSGVDGIITKEKHVGLLIRHADCQAALIYDPINEVIAAVHAGFRGQAQQIYTKCLLELSQKFGSKAEDLKIAFSSSLGLCHSEFINYKEEFPEKFHKYCQDNYMDLKLMAKDELLACGVKESHIDIKTCCTYCSSDLFFSYRKDKTTQRMASLIALC